MTTEERLRKIGWKSLVALGLFFGIGFTVGFLAGFEYGFSNRPTDSSLEARSEGVVPPSPNASIEPPQSASLGALQNENTKGYDADDEGEAVIESGEFTLAEHELGDDENGLFISGTVVNRSQNAFDAVQVSFELCDTKGNAYATVTDRTTERMDPGDSWGFVVYIPYAEMKQFHSYRLQGIMGIRK